MTSPRTPVANAGSIVSTAPELSGAAWERLEAHGLRVVKTSMTISASELEQVIAAADPVGIISRGAQLSAAAIAAAPRLKVISKYGVGYDNIAIAAATARGVPVYITRGANSQSVAELAIGLMLGVARHIREQDMELRQGQWHRPNRGIELSGRTLGIVGFGAVGSRVAAIATALGMRIAVFDPYIDATLLPDGVECVDRLPLLLERTDILSLHCPLTNATRGMIGAAELARLKRGAIVINTARGGIVDEHALSEALTSGFLTGAGIDTHSDEPPSKPTPLAQAPHVLLTAHCGASTRDAAERLSLAVIDNLLRGLNGESLDSPNLVNPGVLG
ncbi:Hydroxyacid dehydrogenase [Hyphomicrobiales bacterium]|nr:Hydroxyacid dehydrogenase [Hyphomicrobiales bacterium]CAH1693218.1 Hydroxyacid dehydrogenase [Hyphomicrobiales bacterium]